MVKTQKRLPENKNSQKKPKQDNSTMREEEWIVN
jgi:hypothetical protein